MKLFISVINNQFDYLLILVIYFCEGTFNCQLVRQSIWPVLYIYFLFSDFNNGSHSPAKCTEKGRNWKARQTSFHQEDDSKEGTEFIHIK